MNSLPIAVYGTLRSTRVRQQLGVDHLLTPMGRCTFLGRLYDLGAYPGLVLFPPGPVPVTGELLLPAHADVLSILDRYEGYHPDRPHTSTYRRVEVTLQNPHRRAWVYAYARPVPADALVASGDWLAFRGE